MSDVILLFGSNRVDLGKDCLVRKDKNDVNRAAFRAFHCIYTRSVRLGPIRFPYQFRASSKRIRSRVTLPKKFNLSLCDLCIWWEMKFMIGPTDCSILILAYLNTLTLHGRRRVELTSQKFLLDNF